VGGRDCSKKSLKRQHSFIFCFRDSGFLFKLNWFESVGECEREAMASSTRSTGSGPLAGSGLGGTDFFGEVVLHVSRVMQFYQGDGFFRRLPSLAGGLIWVSFVPGGTLADFSAVYPGLKSWAIFAEIAFRIAFLMAGHFAPDPTTSRTHPGDNGSSS
jgi:hypothetical protein